MDRFYKIIIYSVVIVLALLWIAPVFLVLMNSVKTLSDYTRGSIWELPTTFAFFDNVKTAMGAGKIGLGMSVSMLYGVFGAAGSIVLSVLAAYGIVIMRLKGGFYWFLLIYSGTIFPFQMYLIPLFKGYQKFGLYNTFEGMLLFYIAISVPFCVFLMRNYMTTISREIVEAGQIDGCNSFSILTRIILPLVIPPVSVLFLFQFTWIWNDLLFGMTLTRSESIRPVMAGIAAIKGTYFSSGLTALLAGIIVTSLPTLILFFALQKNFIKGMHITVKS